MFHSGGGYLIFHDEKSTYRVSFTYMREGSELYHISNYASDYSYDSFRGVYTYIVDRAKVVGRDVVSFTWDLHDFYIMIYSGDVWRPVDKNYMRGLRIGGPTRYEDIYRSTWPALCRLATEVASFEAIAGFRMSDDKTLKSFIDYHMGYWRCGMFPTDNERIECLEECYRVLLRDWLVVSIARSLGLRYVYRLSGPVVTYILFDMERSLIARTDLSKEVIYGKGGERVKLVLDLSINTVDTPTSRPKLAVKIVRDTSQLHLARLVKMFYSPERLFIIAMRSTPGAERGGDEEIYTFTDPSEYRAKELIERISRELKALASA